MLYLIVLRILVRIGVNAYFKQVSDVQLKGCYSKFGEDFWGQTITMTVVISNQAIFGSSEGIFAEGFLKHNC